MSSHEGTLAVVTVESGGEAYAQTIRGGKHSFASDEPPSLGGKDSGPAPYQLLLGALGSCTSITLQMYAKRKGWELGKVTVRLKIYRDGETERIERTLELSPSLSAEQKDKLLEISGKTPVTKTLMQGVKIETKLG